MISTDYNCEVSVLRMLLLTKLSQINTRDDPTLSTWQISTHCLRLHSGISSFPSIITHILFCAFHAQGAVDHQKTLPLSHQFFRKNLCDARI